MFNSSSNFVSLEKERERGRITCVGKNEGASPRSQLRAHNLREPGMSLWIMAIRHVQNKTIFTSIYSNFCNVKNAKYM